MAITTQGLYCTTCGRQTLHLEGDRVNHILHFLLGLLTCSLWWIAWLIIVLGHSPRWACSTCGLVYDDRRAREAQGLIPVAMAPPEPQQESGTEPPTQPGRRSELARWGIPLAIMGIPVLIALLLAAVLMIPAQPQPTPLPTPAASPASIPFDASGNAAHDLLAKMPDLDRNRVLAMSVRSSLEACASGRRNFFQGFDANRNAFWNVECSSGRTFGVMYYNDGRGSTKVLDCATLKLVAGTQCFTKF